MLSVRLDPVQTQSVEECREALHRSAPGPIQDWGTGRFGRTHLHDTEDGQGEGEPHGEHDDEEDSVGDGVALEQERVLDGHGVEHLGELGVSEGQRPETEVGRAGRSASGET